MEFKEDKIFKTSHQIIKDGAKIKYDAFVERTNVLIDSKVVATMYYYYYKAMDDIPNKPVLFSYNGGPGSGSVWVNLGFLGPRRVHFDNPTHPKMVPPFYLEDNPYTPVDYADIIVIDPVGCGYSRLLDKEYEKSFYGADEDASTISLYIEYLTNKYHLFNRPKFLFGESYGTFRNCLVSNELTGGSDCLSGQMIGISLNGIINIGTFIYGDHPDFNPVLDLYGNAMTHYYHTPSIKESLEEFKKKVWDFMGHEYQTALFYGRDYKDIDKVVKKLSYFTGMEPKYFYEHDLLLDTQDFISMHGKGSYDIGFYDGRFKMPHINQGHPRELIANDAAMAMYTPLFLAGMDLLKEELQIETNEAYHSINLEVNKIWNRKPKRSSKNCLIDALRRNDSLKVLFQAGLYDLCTQPGATKYLISHSDMDKNRVFYKEYESGHMIYIGEEPSMKMAKDLKEFVLSK